MSTNQQEQKDFNQATCNLKINIYSSVKGHPRLQHLHLTLFYIHVIKEI